MVDNIKIKKLQGNDPALAEKAKRLKSQGWQFVEKKNGQVIYEKAENPLYKVDSTYLTLFIFLSIFVIIFIFGVLLY